MPWSYNCLHSAPPPGGGLVFPKVADGVGAGGRPPSRGGGVPHSVGEGAGNSFALFFLWSRGRVARGIPPPGGRMSDWLAQKKCLIGLCLRKSDPPSPGWVLYGHDAYPWLNEESCGLVGFCKSRGAILLVDAFLFCAD